MPKIALPKFEDLQGSCACTPRAAPQPPPRSAEHVLGVNSHTHTRVKTPVFKCLLLARLKIGQGFNIFFAGRL